MLFDTSGSAESFNVKKSETPTFVDAFSYYFTIEILNRVYNDSLMNPDSPDYEKMQSEVIDTVSVRFLFYFKQ